VHCPIAYNRIEAMPARIANVTRSGSLSMPGTSMDPAAAGFYPAAVAEAVGTVIGRAGAVAAN